METELDASVGDIIFYRLKPEDLPVNPETQWKRRIEKVYPKTECSICFLVVSSLEQGYEGLCEIVYPSQIIEIRG